MTLKRYILYLFLIVLSFTKLSAITSEADSLEHMLINHHKIDVVKVDLLNKTAEAYQTSNPKKSISYLNKSLRFADSISYTNGKAEALFQISAYYNTISDLDKAIQYAHKSLAIFQELDNKPGTIKCMLKIGTAHYLLGDINLAMNYKKQALDLSILIKDSAHISYCYSTLGTNHCDIGNFSIAEDYEKKALDIAYKINEPDVISYALNNLGYVYDVQNNHYRALECFQKSFKIDEEQKNYKDACISASNIAFILNIQGNYIDALAYCQKGLNYANIVGFKIGKSYNYEYMGLTYKTMGDYEKALENQLKVLSLQKEIGNKTGLAHAYKDLGEVYLLQKDYKKAIDYYNNSLTVSKEINNTQIIMLSYVGIAEALLKLKNYTLAQSYSQKAYTMANRIGNIDLIKKSTKVLAQCKATLNQFKEAYNLYVTYKNMSDSLLNKEKIRSIANLEYQYKIEKEKELFELEQQKKDVVYAETEKRQRIIRYALTFGLALVVILASVVLNSLLHNRKANLLLAAQKRQIEDKNKELILQKEEIETFATELEKANQTKDKFFSIIAHDLKSPFNGILGFTDLLLENHNQIDAQERQMYIQHINDSSVKTYNLLENMLTWAQTQSGSIRFSPVEVNIENIVNEVTSVLKDSARNKNLRVISEINQDLIINADKNMLHAIVLNLVSNAIKFTPEGGEVIIKAHKIINHNDATHIQISVADTGVGISTETQSKLFNITETTSTEGTANESGTGLGLLLCKEFIDKHNGDIWVESQIDKGSKFLFTIPLSIRVN